MLENFNEYMPLLLEGAKITVLLCVITLVFALPLGIPFALGVRSRIKPIKYLCECYVLIFRGTPLLLQLWFFYYLFPMYLGIQVDEFETAAFAFVLNYVAYFAEIYRGGINSIDKGQYEAAFALGVPRWRTMKDIILPQAMKAMLPPIANEAIVLIKDTALASAITLMDIMKVSQAVVSRNSDIKIFLYAAVIYLILTGITTIIAKRIEKRFSRHVQREEN